MFKLFLLCCLIDIQPKQALALIIPLQFHCLRTFLEIILVLLKPTSNLLKKIKKEK